MNEDRDAVMKALRATRERKVARKRRYRAERHIELDELRERREE